MPPVLRERRIRINPCEAGERSYPVYVGMGIIRSFPSRLPRLAPAHRYFLISDANVARLHGRRLGTRLRRAGHLVELLTVPAGERSKRREVKARLEDRILARGGGRDSTVLALGGGMVCDLAGFVAATLHRGIPFLSLPTSLLAMVDAAIGGKTAVNHPRGKNLIGAFHQPRAVFADVEFLATLPPREFRSGLAEVVKSAVIGNARLFEELERFSGKVLSRDPRTMVSLVTACCRLKGSVVSDDPRESNRRAILNFGHTLGHALEHLTRFRLTHGEAVAIGMMLEARAATLAGILRRGDLQRMEGVLEALGLPTRPPRAIKARQLLLAARSDKKTEGGRVRYALPKRIGEMAQRGGRFSLPLSPARVAGAISRPR